MMLFGFPPEPGALAYLSDPRGVLVGGVPGPRGFPVDSWESALDGTAVQFYSHGVPVGEPFTLPSAAWNTISGKPTVVAAGATTSEARDVIGAVSTDQVDGLVADAIAADGTVAAAAAAAAETAVTAEIADRDIVETIQRFPAEGEWGVTGANGYATDLLVDAAGAVVPSTFTRWFNRFLGLGFVKALISGVSGGGFAGENGYATELVFDDQGKVPSWVLQQWADRMPAPADAAQIVLPSTLYMVAGQTYRLEYAKIIAAFDRTADVTVTGPTSGTRNFGTYWEYTPAAAETFTITITVKNRGGSTTTTASRPVVVLAAPTATGLRELAIGDSITRNGEYARTAAITALAGQTVGIRSYDNGVLNVEGRAGWSVVKYSSFIGLTTDSDSPFLFPTTVTGAHYRGNTEFWRQVVATTPGSGTVFDGFQRIARNWTTAGAFLFDSSGYPVSPTSGDVVLDPTQASGSRWRQWDGSAWQTMSPQPATAFSFSKYLDRYSAAFAGGNPTCISIMLGTNDFFSALDDTSWAAFTTGMDQIIATIRAWSATVPIVLVGPPSPGPDQFWSAADATVNRADFQRRIIDVSKRLLAYYDTSAQRTAHVYALSFLGTTADANIPDYVHPNTAGHQQMGPWLAGMLAHLINIGVI